MNNLFTQTKLDFKLLKQIGKGGEANVFKTHDRQLNSIIAVKKIAAKSLLKESEYFEEAKKIYKTRHQNVVPIQYACKDDESIFIAMPLYKNGSIKSLMDKRFLTSREIVRYSLQFLAGLNHIHVKGLLHFDIKPGNILITDSNHAVISDFGLAAYSGKFGFSKINGTTEVLAPPEFFDQKQHNLKFDIYQTGLTLYRMCVGDTIFLNQVKVAHEKKGIMDRTYFIENLKKGKYPETSSYNEHIPIPLRKIIKRAISTNPDDRYDSVIDLMNDLSAIERADDWQFETNYTTTEKWTKSIYEVSASSNGADWEVTSTKKRRNKNDYCGKKLNKSDKKALVYKALSNDW